MSSIRRRLTVHLVLLFVVLFVAVLGAVYAAVRSTLTANLDASLRDRVVTLASLAEDERAGVELELPVRFARSIGDKKHAVLFQMRDENGASVHRSPALQSADLPGDFHGTLEHPEFKDIRLPDGGAGRAVGCTFYPDLHGGKTAAERPSPALLVLATDRHELDETLGFVLTAFAVSGGLMLISIGVLIPRILRRDLAPLDALGRRAAELEAEKLSERFPAEGIPEELAPITGRLNDFLSRIEVSFERERRFGADLSHELRTPIAELKSLAECAVRWPDMRGEQSYADMLAVSTHMESLVTRMLALASGRNGTTPVTTDPVPVAALAKELAGFFSERAAARSLVFDIACDDTAPAADPVLLKAILSNLIDNAVDYAPEGSLIAIHGETTRVGYALTVTNACADLDASNVAAMFDSFWRKQKSRTDRHAGLGLPLSRTFAEAMGWQLSARLTAPAIIAFTLEKRS